MTAVDDRVVHGLSHSRHSPQEATILLRNIPKNSIVTREGHTVVPGFRVLGFRALPGFRALNPGDGGWSVQKMLFVFRAPFSGPFDQNWVEFNLGKY